MSWKCLSIGLAVLAAMGSGCAADGNEVEEENTGEASQAEVVPFLSATCPYSVAQVSAVNPDKVMIIRDPSVVDDACRTEWSNPVGCGASIGKWTFWQLMENMRGSTPTTAEFILRFLEQFRDTSPVNSFPMQDRSKIQALVIDPWRRASGCMPGSWASAPCPGLRKDLAPFRLLAIVNRMDLHTSQGGYGGGAGGEGRLIFGFLDGRQYLNANNNHNGMMPKDLSSIQATVILEYGIAASTPFLLFSSASQWWALNSIGFGATFNQQLQSITDSFTGANLKPAQPNGSLLNQIRTDEIDFDPSDPNVQPPQWEMREYKLTCAVGQPPCSTALVKRAPVTLTPDNSFGFDMNVNDDLHLPPSTLSDFLQDATFGTQIDLESYSVPATYNGKPFQGGASRQGEFSSESQTWVNTKNIKPTNWTTTFFAPNTPSNLIVRNRRRLFGLGTCNGCHYNETKTMQLHVGTRDYNTSAALSPFLAVPATSSYTVTDPVTKAPFAYSEPRRRICEFLWVKDGHFTRLTTNAGRPH